MIESLNTIRSLGLPPVIEDLYFGRPVPGDLRIYMNYPSEFRGARLDAWAPLTEGGLIPLVDDGNFSEVGLYDPGNGTFIVKSIEEPDRTLRRFDSWQQYLAFRLLAIADSGAGEEELARVAEVVAFKYTAPLLSLLREMETLPDQEIDQRTERFIAECAGQG